MTRFVILGYGRTGSTWLCSLLDSHPAVCCHREVFSDHAVPSARLDYAPGYHSISSLPERWSAARRDAAPGAFLEDLLRDEGEGQATGFKLLAQHVHALGRRDPRFLTRLLSDPRIRKLILRRENRVRVLVSRKRAELAGYRGCSYDGLAVDLDPRELTAWAAAHDRFYDELAEATAGSPVRTVSYERLPEPEYRSGILDFLCVEPRDVPLRSARERQSQDSLRDAIANFDEVARAVAGTSLEADLHG